MTWMRVLPASGMNIICKYLSASWKDMITSNPLAWTCRLQRYTAHGVKQSYFVRIFFGEKIWHSSFQKPIRKQPNAAHW